MSLSKEEILKALKEGKEITVSRNGYTPTSFFIDQKDKVYFHNKDITSSEYREHPNNLSEMLNFFESAQKENFNVEITEKTRVQDKNTLFDLFLNTKGITKEEYKKLNLNYDDEFMEFNEEMAEKYPDDNINLKNPTDDFIQYVTREIEKPEYVPSFPILLMKDRDVELLKYSDGVDTNYSVDINNRLVGMSICFTDDLEKAINFYNKEKFYNRIQNVDDEIINKISGVSGIYGKDYDKAIICEENLNIYGRRTTLIDYFNNQLAHVNEYFPNEEHINKIFINNTNETIEELKNSKNQLEPVYLFVHPMDNTFHIANEKEQLENIKNLYDSVYEELLELPDSEESENNEDEER